MASGTADMKAVAERGRRAVKRKVDEFALMTEPLMREAESKGLKSNASIASFLADHGVPTRLGGDVWNESLVRSIRARLAVLARQD